MSYRVGNDCKRDTCFKPGIEGSPPLQILSPALGTDVLAARMSPLLLWVPLARHTTLGSTSRAIAQMNPTSSRATAMIAFGADLPLAVSLR